MLFTESLFVYVYVLIDDLIAAGAIAAVHETVCHWAAIGGTRSFADLLGQAFERCGLSPRMAGNRWGCPPERGCECRSDR